MNASLRRAVVVIGWILFSGLASLIVGSVEGARYGHQMRGGTIGDPGSFVLEAIHFAWVVGVTFGLLLTLGAGLALIVKLIKLLR